MNYIKTLEINQENSNSPKGKTLTVEEAMQRFQDKLNKVKEPFGEPTTLESRKIPDK